MNFKTNRSKMAEWAEVAGFAIWIFLFMFILPYFVLFVAGGASATVTTAGVPIERVGIFSESLIKTSFYYAIGAGALLLYLILKVIENIIRTDKKAYVRYGWVNAIIHDPSKGIGGINKIRIFNNPLKLFLISILFFGFLSLVSTTATNTVLSDVPQITMEVVPSAEIWLSMEPAASSETIVFGVLISLALGFLSWGLYRLKIEKGLLYWGLSLLFIILFGLLWMGYHSIVYGNDEAALTSTFVFGLIGSASVILIGSIIPWIVFHQINNLVVKSVVVYGMDAVRTVGFITYGLIFIFTISYIILSFNKKPTFSSGDY